MLAVTYYSITTMSASHQSASPGDRSPSTGANVPLLVGLYAATTDDDDDDMDFTPGFEELDSDEEYEGAHCSWW